MVAQVDEQHAAMVADTMAPAGQTDGLVDVGVAERAAGVGPVTMHGYPEKLVLEGRIERPEPALPKSVRVYPRRCSAATEGERFRRQNRRLGGQKCAKIRAEPANRPQTD